MRLLDSLRRRMATLFRRSLMNAEIEDELHSHIQHRADDLERSGLQRAEAERRARIEFGGQVRYAEESQEAMGSNFFETLIQDVRFSLRKLRKSPGFTIVAVLTLALAIGANAVVFSVMNALVLRPLNVPHAQSLYQLGRTGEKWGGNESYPSYLDLRDRNRSFEGLAADNISGAGLDAGEGPSRAWGYEVTGNYFDVLGIQPYLGRVIHASDEHGPNSAPYLVLSYAYWHTHFQDDRSMVGRVIQLNKHPFTIIGVAPPKFVGTLLIFSPDFFVPMVNQEQVDGQSVLNMRSNHWLGDVFGHLKAGVTRAQAIADLNSIGSYMEKTYPKEESRVTYSMGHPTVGDVFDGAVRAFVTGLMLLAVLILLAACANLGSLFAARAADRGREIALRLALGARRMRILRQLFTEAVLVSLTGGAIGLWGSILLLHGLSVWQPFPEFPMNVPVTPDAAVYLAALLLSLASGLLFGVVPVKQVFITYPYEVIKRGSTGTVTGRITVRDLLLGLQIAICAVLVTSSMVALRGLARSLHGNFGVEPKNATLVETDLTTAGYSSDNMPVMQKRMIDALAAIPGVMSVGLVGQYPPLHMGWTDTNVFTDTTSDLRPSNAAGDAIQYTISPQYFHAAGTALLAGRTVTWHDDKDAPRVAVINREFARKFFGSVSNAMGRYYKMPNGTRNQVVGIVEDGKYTANLAEDAQPAMFLPLLQSPSSETWLIVRSGSDAQHLAAAIRSTLRDLDPGLVSFIQTWNQEMNGALFVPRMATVSLGVLGVMGAMLSITGIFGMASHSISKRKRELGIRMALGAQRKEVLKAALGRAFKLLGFGSAAGLLLGILASRVLALIVYQATPRDPLVLAGVVFAMALVGLLATWIPAQRALSLDPLILLREE
ncbi:MAG TPA: ABC transporter permease [Terriglobia bacterium]|nr:ABC transporter permease [Terriglobia bacterium]